MFEVNFFLTQFSTTAIKNKNRADIGADLKSEENGQPRDNFKFK